jgi:hypothetical protein
LLSVIDLLRRRLRQLARHRAVLRRRARVPIRIRRRSPARRHRTRRQHLRPRSIGNLRLRPVGDLLLLLCTLLRLLLCRLSKPRLSEQCARQSPRQYALTYHAKSPIPYRQPTVTETYPSIRLPAHHRRRHPYPATPDAAYPCWTRPPPTTLRPSSSRPAAFFSKLSSNFVV